MNDVVIEDWAVAIAVNGCFGIVKAFGCTLEIFS